MPAAGARSAAAHPAAGARGDRRAASPRPFPRRARARERGRCRRDSVPAPCSFGDLVAHHAHGKLAFDRLDRRVQRVGHVALDRIDSVGGRSRAHSAAVRFVKGPGAAVAALAAEHHVAHRPAAARSNSLRRGLRQRLQDDVGVARARLDVSARDRRGPARIEQRPHGHVHVDRTKAAFVHRDRRIGHGAERIVNARERHAEDRIDRRADLCGVPV